MFKRFTSKKALGLVATAIITSIVAQMLIFPNLFNKNEVNVNAAESDFPTKMDSTSAINYATILGGAVDYGVVSPKFYQLMHTETTIATNYYFHGTSNIDVDFIDNTGLFIIDQLAPNGATYTDSKGEHTADGQIHFGQSTVHSLYLEASNEVFGEGFDPDIHQASMHNGNLFFTGDYNGAPVTQSAYERVEGGNANVNRLINRISGTDGRSTFLDSRANSEYAINYNGEDKYDNYHFFTDQNGTAISDSNPISNADKIKLNLNYDEFENQVVYVNVNQEMLNIITKDLDKFYITKRPSTTVVINIPTNVTIPEGNSLRGVHLIVVDGDGNKLYEKSSGKTSSMGARNDEEGNTISNTEKYYNEHIVWNVMSTGTIKLHNMAGVMLFPKAELVRMDSGNQSGWLVANCPVENATEFHFIYDGGITNVPGQMHFAILKGFTTEYAAKDDVKPLTSIGISDGDFKFKWLEVDSFGSTTPYTNSVTGETSRVVDRDVDSNCSAIFPTLTFTTGTAIKSESDHYYIQTPGESDAVEYNAESYFFRVSEDPTVGIEGVSNSAGHIDIELQVRVDKTGNFTYWVKYTTYTGDDGSVVYEDKTSDYVQMKGIQFDLGTFYNKANNALVITKNIEGDYTPTTDKTYEFYVYTEVGGTKTWYKADGTPSTTQVAVEVTVPAGEKTASISIPTLPVGTYKIEEVAGSADVSGYDLDDGSHAATASITTEAPLAQASITNRYSKQYNLAVTKNVSGTGASNIPEDATFKFTISNGTQYVQADGNLDNDPHDFEIKNGETVKLIVPEGTYTILEDTEVARSYGSGNIVFDSDTSVVRASASVAADTLNPTPATLKNVYKDKSFGSITLSKVVTGLSNGDSFKDDQVFEFKVYYYPNNDTNQPPVILAYDNNSGVTSISGWDGQTVKVHQGESITMSGSCIPSDAHIYIEEKDPSTMLDNWRFTLNRTHTYISTNVTVDGVTVSGLNADFNLTDGAATCVYTNTYDETPTPVPTGSLKVTKTVETATGSEAAPSDATFGIQVAFTVPTGTTLAGTYSVNGGTATDITNATVTVDLKADEYVEFTGIPAGITYEVTEPTVPANFADSYVGATGEIEEGVTSNATVTNTYDYTAPTPVPTGSLTVEKTVVTAAGSDAAPDLAFGIQVKFTVPTGTTLAGTYTVNGGTATDITSDTVTVSLKAGQSAEFTGIPEGVTYEVTEPTVPEHFRVAYTTATGTIEENTTKTATVTNTYNYTAPAPVPTGSLTVEKTVVTAAGSDAAPDLAFGIQVKFTVPTGTTLAGTYTVNGGTATDITSDTVTVSLKAGQSAEFTGIPEGVTYEVTEPTVPEHFRVAYTTATGTIEENTTKTATVTNTYNYTAPTPVPTGSLTVEKTVVTAAGSDAAPDLAFGIQVKFTVPTGTTLAGTYTVNGGTATDITSDTVTVSLKAGQSAEFTGIPEGVTYEVTEPTVPEHFRVAYTTATGTIEENTTKTATVTNTYNYTAPTPVPTGSLTVEKTVVTAAGSDAAPDLAFGIQVKFTVPTGTTLAGTYSVNGGAASPITETVTFDLKAGQSAEFTGIPEGVTYTVTEPTVPEHFSVAYTTASGTIEENTTKTATVTNTYNYTAPAPVVGSLTLNKQVIGCSALNSTPVTFYVQNVTTGKYYSDEAVESDDPVAITVIPGTAKVIRNLPEGEYEVTETAPTVPGGYRNDDANSVRSGRDTVSAAGAASVTLKNAYTEIPAPTVSSTPIATATPVATATPKPTPTTVTKHPVTFTKDDITTLENLPGTEIIIKDKDGNPVGTWTHGDTPETIDLPAGTYTLEETSTPTGYKPILPGTTFTIDDNGDIVSATGSARVDDKNMNLLIVDYEPITPATVTISKQDIAGNEIPQATLTITSIDGFDLSGCVITQNGALVTTTLSNRNTSISFVTISTWPSIVRGLQPGTYELKETVTPEAYLTAEAILFTVRDDGSVYVGTVEMQGSKIVMVDKADPTYNQKTTNNNNTAVPATGEAMSIFTVASITLVMLASCIMGLVFYRKWRESEQE